ncbi:MAG: 50S ribosomal protein L6 [Parcubacteria group bacterium]|jgi:large subunit ribosomal protein L6
MSKIGKQIINIPESVQTNINAAVIKFSGKNGVLEVPILPGVLPKLEGDILSFEVLTSDKQARSNWGTMRALAANALQGAMEDFVKELKIEGVGYRANIEDNAVVLNVGFSHPVKFNLPEGIKAATEKNILKISGADKRLVGEIAAKIRAVKKPEPYKGTGIMYVNEVIRRKAGKKVAGSEEGK